MSKRPKLFSTMGVVSVMQKLSHPSPSVMQKLHNSLIHHLLLCKNSLIHHLNSIFSPGSTSMCHEENYKTLNLSRSVILFIDLLWTSWWLEHPRKCFPLLIPSVSNLLFCSSQLPLNSSIVWLQLQSMLEALNCSINIIECDACLSLTEKSFWVSLPFTQCKVCI